MLLSLGCQLSGFSQIGQSGWLLLLRHWEVPTREGRGFPFILFTITTLCPLSITSLPLHPSNPKHSPLRSAMTTFAPPPSVLASSSLALLLRKARTLTASGWRHPELLGWGRPVPLPWWWQVTPGPTTHSYSTKKISPRSCCSVWNRR
jgi:hypothetical protein